MGSRRPVRHRAAARQADLLVRGGIAPADPGAAAALRERLIGWHAPIGALLTATAPGDVVGATVLEDLPQLARWTRGRLALLGDAADATTPNLGQGAAQALEDAAALVRAVAATPADLPGALRDYETTRKARAELVVPARAPSVASLTSTGSSPPVCATSPSAPLPQP